jgi:hypothetical protein
VKNLTSGPQAVTINGPKLRILRTLPQSTQGDVLELETTVVNLAPGATQRVGQEVNVAPGVREYFARVDVDDMLHEPVVQRANNEKRLKITIPQVSAQLAPATPQKETQLLDYDKAKSAGAQFLISRDGSNACVTEQYNLNIYPSPGKPPAGVEFRLSCTLTGGSANAEGFANFRLKNGWKVKSFDVFRVAQGGVNADWSWTRTPSIGSDDPSSKLHMWAEPGSTILIDVKVEVEGPAGTNPYQ